MFLLCLTQYLQNIMENMDTSDKAKTMKTVEQIQTAPNKLNTLVKLLKLIKELKKNQQTTSLKSNNEASKKASSKEVASKKTSSKEKSPKKAISMKPKQSINNGIKIGSRTYVKVVKCKVPYINIRDYHYKSGVMYPSKIGITLSVDEWNNLKKHIVDIDKVIKEN